MSKTHGKSKWPEHRIWRAMKERCYYEKHIVYKYYGGRGIEVCQRWRHSFENFLEDMGPRPSSKHSIDRMDCDGDYSPGNCRWATVDEQRKNKRNAIILTHGGRTMCLADWARVLGIHWASLYERLQKYPTEMALSVPRILNGRRLSVVHEEALRSVPN